MEQFPRENLVELQGGVCEFHHGRYGPDPRLKVGNKAEGVAKLHIAQDTIFLRAGYFETQSQKLALLPRVVGSEIAMTKTGKTLGGQLVQNRLVIGGF